MRFFSVKDQKYLVYKNMDYKKAPAFRGFFVCYNNLTMILIIAL